MLDVIMKSADKKAPRIPFLLLRKSRGGREVPVLKETDFPISFMTGNKAYEIRRTKEGKVIMVKAE